ncbi:TIGR00270 family protein [Candidatus Micrarchaeota archaeon]|nr:TIGR00270 family protein [Candidatus Micrarchaeota archaeon]
MTELSCDICGATPIKAQILIEGAKLLVCGRCAKSGKILHYFHDEEEAENPHKISAPPPKSIGPEEEIVESYGEIIRKARQKKNLTIEELGARILEKANFLHAIETERLKPTISVAKKLEKELEIKIIQSSSGDLSPSNLNQGRKEFHEPTLGDFKG